MKFLSCKFSLENVGRRKEGRKNLDLGNKITYSESMDLSKLIYGGDLSILLFQCPCRLSSFLPC